MLTLAQLAELLNGVWHGNANHAIFSLSSLNCATSSDLVYFDNLLFKDALNSSLAGAVVLRVEHLPLCRTNSIVVADPYLSMLAAAKYFSIPVKKTFEIHSTAQIHPTAQLGANCTVGANSVVGEQAHLADGVCIGVNTVIEPGVYIGKDSLIKNGVVVHSGSRLGQNVVINSGSIIGAMPFNYLKQQGIWKPELVVGGVVIADGVHIGANTVLDRGSLSDTYIGEGVCIDNLVQIAHDVIIGANTVIAGCATIGAYVQIDKDCIIGGASCIAAKVCLSRDVVITGMSTVNKSILKSGIYSSGTLVHEHQRWRRNAARFKRLDDYLIRLKALEKQIGT